MIIVQFVGDSLCIKNIYTFGDIRNFKGPNFEEGFAHSRNIKR